MSDTRHAARGAAMTSSPPTDQQLDEIQAIASRAADDPFYLSDCEGSLQVWREKALTHVRRDANGEIEMYSFPSTYKITDQIIELDLSTWDPGEDATDDQQRQDIGDLVQARAALPVLVAKVQQLRAVLAAERSAHLFTLRQRNNRSNRITHLRDLAVAGDVEALLAAAKDTLAASRDDHTACAVSAPPAAPLAASQGSGVSESAQSPTGAATGALRDFAPAADFTGTQPCGHDDYHDRHPWHDRPDVWCPGHSYDDDHATA